MSRAVVSAGRFPRIHEPNTACFETGDIAGGESSRPVMLAMQSIDITAISDCAIEFATNRRWLRFTEGIAVKISGPLENFTNLLSSLHRFSCE